MKLSLERRALFQVYLSNKDSATMNNYAININNMVSRDLENWHVWDVEIVKPDLSICRKYSGYIYVLLK